MLPLPLWHTMLLLGVGMCVGYNPPHDGVDKKEIEDQHQTNGIQLIK